MGKPKTHIEKASEQLRDTPVDFDILQKLAVEFILARKDLMFAEVEKALVMSENQTHVWSRDLADKPLCQWMALAYAAGYKQAKESPVYKSRLIL
jgi:hypothetical protein